MHEGSLEWAALARPRLGETISGDASVVKVVPGGAMVAVIDGLGHGQAAATVSALAAAVVAGSDDRDVLSVMHRCHQELQGTRGAAMSLAWFSFDAHTVTWLALGDVEGRVLPGRPGDGSVRSLRVPGGLAGHDSSISVPETVAVQRGDVVVLATDGVATSFGDALSLVGSAQDIAERILELHWDGADDGMVVVVRCLPAAIAGSR